MSEGNVMSVMAVASGAGRIGKLFVSAMVVFGLLVTSLPVMAADGAEHAVARGDETHPPYLLAARDSVELEDRSGYSGEYIFGMTKGLMRSTLTPALKPVVMILTVPLDLVFLPFAAIAGFF
jgi:hypothetical protein